MDWPLHVPRTFLASNDLHPAVRAVGELRIKASQRPFDGNPYTRLAMPLGYVMQYAPSQCSFQGTALVMRYRARALALFSGDL
jgi:hypothetical protein